MPIARLAKAKQPLQQAVDRGRSKQVPTAHDVGDALKRIVDHHRQMVARRQIPPAQDDVAPNLRDGWMLRRNVSLAILDPAKMSRSGVARTASCRGGTRLCRRGRDGHRILPETARGRFLDKAARRPGRAARSRRGRSPRGCKSRGRPNPADQGGRAPPRSRRHVRSAGEVRGSEARASRGHRVSRPRIAACSGCGLDLQCAAARGR